ncbi:MAG: hypothetical protein AB7H97_22650 [Pseudobdellovibrionaceae bacterium]
MAAWPRSLNGTVKNFDTVFVHFQTAGMSILLFGLFGLFFSPAQSAQAAEIIFEGYYRVEVEGSGVGYAIQRYEFDPKAKTFQAISFLRTKIGDQVVQESLKAKSNNKFQPISYNYTSLVGTALSSIDATFKGTIMTVKKSDGKAVKTETSKIPEGTFLSTFLIFVMLQKKLIVDQAFKYSAVAEEDGASYNGKAWLQAKEGSGPLTKFRILNTFKGQDFISNVVATPDPNPAEKDKYVKAEITGTDSPKMKLTTRLLPANAATEGQMVPNKTLISLFGGVPTGKVNVVANPPKDK